MNFLKVVLCLSSFLSLTGAHNEMEKRFQNFKGNKDEILDLSYCNITNNIFLSEVIPFIKSKNVMNLDITFNDIDDNVFSHKIDLQLEYLNASENSFVFFELSKKCNLSIKILLLERCFSLRPTSLNNIKKIKNLTDLSLSRCWSIGNFFNDLAYFSGNRACEILRDINLINLSMEGNLISNNGFLCLLQNKYLQTLDLTDNDISDFDSPYISSSSLSALKLDNCVVSSKFLKSIAKNKNLKRLSLSKNQITIGEANILKDMPLDLLILKDNPLSLEDKEVFKLASISKDIQF